MKDQWLLSQRMFGWPAHRPRLYTILSRKDAGCFTGVGLQAVHGLYRNVTGSVIDLLAAPSDSQQSLE